MAGGILPLRPMLAKDSLVMFPCKLHPTPTKVLHGSFPFQFSASELGYMNPAATSSSRLTPGSHGFPGSCKQNRSDVATKSGFRSPENSGIGPCSKLFVRVNFFRDFNLTRLSGTGPVSLLSRSCKSHRLSNPVKSGKGPVKELDCSHSCCRDVMLLTKLIDPLKLLPFWLLSQSCTNCTPASDAGTGPER